MCSDKVRERLKRKHEAVLPSKLCFSLHQLLKITCWTHAESSGLCSSQMNPTPPVSLFHSPKKSYKFRLFTDYLVSRDVFEEVTHLVGVNATLTCAGKHF